MFNLVRCRQVGVSRGNVLRTPEKPVAKIATRWAPSGRGRLHPAAQFQATRMPARWAMKFLLLRNSVPECSLQFGNGCLPHDRFNEVVK
jgi:hypothetical protein